MLFCFSHNFFRILSVRDKGIRLDVAILPIPGNPGLYTHTTCTCMLSGNNSYKKYSSGKQNHQHTRRKGWRGGGARKWTGWLYPQRYCACLCIVNCFKCFPYVYERLGFDNPQKKGLSKELHNKPYLKTY